MRRFLNVLFVAALVVLFGMYARGHAAPDVRVVLETDPPGQAIVPDETLVTTRLRVLDASDQPVAGARIALHLDTPPRTRFITTDFPFVEGTTLVNLEAPLLEGELSFQTIYPIRGTYTFHTRVTLPDGQTVEASPTLSVREKPAEVRNILLLLGGLFAFGLVSGVIIGLTGHPGAAVAVALLAFWLTGGIALAHDPAGEESKTPSEPITVIHEAEGLRATATISPGSGAVGTLNEIAVRLTTAEGRPAVGHVTVEAIHLEDETPVYRFELPLEADGTARVSVQFFDGAEHELRFTAHAADGRNLAWQVPIAVKGFAPPLSVKLRSLAILLAPVALGLFVGLWVSGKRAKKHHAPSRYQLGTN